MLCNKNAFFLKEWYEHENMLAVNFIDVNSLHVLYLDMSHKKNSRAFRSSTALFFYIFFL